MVETLGIDYKSEYERLKNIEKENIELKETIIEMSKYVFKRDNALVKTINDIGRELRRIDKKLK